MKTVILAATRVAAKNVLASTLLNRMFCIYHVLDFRRVYGERNLVYDRTHVVELTESRPQNSDLQFNFFIRLILENQYETIIEIGSRTAKRAVHLKRLFPRLTVYAVDILREFDSPRDFFGVAIRPYKLDEFPSLIHGKTLCISVGTLPYYQPVELQQFLAAIKQAGIDLAAAELTSNFAKTFSTRRGIISYYHPYLNMLEHAGFAVEFEPSNWSFSLSMMERLDLIHARA